MSHQHVSFGQVPRDECKECGVPKAEHVDESVASLLADIQRGHKLQKKARESGGYLRLNPKGMR